MSWNFRDSAHPGVPSSDQVVELDITEGVLRLSEGRDDCMPHGRTGGYCLRLPDEFEKAASGAIVRVSVEARASSGVRRAGLAVAYSTNDVGNSGWRNFRLRQDFSTFEFTWAVPTMIAGNGDYIGLHAILGLPIEIRRVTAEVVDSSS